MIDKLFERFVGHKGSQLTRRRLRKDTRRVDRVMPLISLPRHALLRGHTGWTHEVEVIAAANDASRNAICLFR